MNMYVIDLFANDTKSFINKMVYIYKNIENNKIFYSRVTRSQKFLSLMIMTHLLFDSPEKKYLEDDGYFLGFFSDYLDIDMVDFKKMKESYDDSVDEYKSLDIVGKDMMFDYFLIQCVNELRNHRDVVANRDITIKELFIGYQEGHFLEYNSLANLLCKKYAPNSCQPLFNESNLCDYYGLELNEEVGMLVPKEKVVQKVKSLNN